MNELRFSVAGARAEPYAAVPTLVLHVAVEAPDGATVRSIALSCQIRIEAQRRRYAPAEEARLEELFGSTARWGETLRPFLWTHVATQVHGFSGAGEFDLAVPCSYDFEVTAAKYLHSLDDGEIPLLLLFSGTVFGADDAGLRVSQVPWSCEARFRLPVRQWRELMDRYYPNQGWLRLERETLDALIRELVGEPDDENGENAA